MKNDKIIKNKKFQKLFYIIILTHISEFLLESSIYAWIILNSEDSSSQALLIGLFIFSSTVPRIFGSAYFGVFSDRIGSSSSIRYSTLGRTVTIALVALLNTNFDLIIQAILLFISVFICSGLNQLLLAGRSKYIKEFIPADSFADASRVSFMALTAISIFSSAAGPVIVEKIGIQYILLIVFLSFFASLLISLSLPQCIVITQERTESDISGFWKDFLRGLSECWDNSNLRPIVVGSFVYGIPLGINNVSLILLWVQAKGASVTQFGIATSLFGVGAFLGPVIFSHIFKNEKKEIVYYVYSLCGLGFCYIFLSVSHGVYISYVIMLLSGAFFSVFATLQQPVILRKSPSEMVGRVSSINSSIMSLTAFIFSLITSFFYSTIDSSPSLYVSSVFIAGILTVAGGVIMMFHKIPFIRINRSA